MSMLSALSLSTIHQALLDFQPDRWTVCQEGTHCWLCLDGVRALLVRQGFANRSSHYLLHKNSPFATFPVWTLLYQGLFQHKIGRISVGMVVRSTTVLADLTRALNPVYSDILTAFDHIVGQESRTKAHGEFYWHPDTGVFFNTLIFGNNIFCESPDAYQVSPEWLGLLACLWNAAEVSDNRALSDITTLSLPAQGPHSIPLVKPCLQSVRILPDPAGSAHAKLAQERCAQQAARGLPQLVASIPSAPPTQDHPLLVLKNGQLFPSL